MPTPDSAWNLFTPQMMDPKNLMAMNQPKNDQGVPQLLQPSPEQLAALQLQHQQAEQEKAIAVDKAKDLAGVQSPAPQPTAPRLPHFVAPNASDQLPPDATSAYLKAISDRQGGVQAERDQMANMGDRPSGFYATDLTPLAGLVDTMTGSNLAKDYKGPQQLQQWDQRKALLQAAIDKNSDKVTDDQLNYLKMLSENTNKKSGDDLRFQIAELKGMMGAGKSGGSQDNKDDRLVNSVYDKFDKDHLLTNYSQRKANLERDMHTLDNAPDGKVTNQTLKEVTNGIAQSLAQGASSADDREKQEYSNLATKWADVMSKMSTVGPTGIADKELIKYVRDQAARIHQSFGNNMAARAKEIGSGRKYHSDYANEAIASKMKQYSDNGSNTVRVRHGGKILEIPEADLPDALNDGAEKL